MFIIKNKIFLYISISVFFIIGFLNLPVQASITNGIIDSTYKYAWGENVGWINFGATNGQVRVKDLELTGYAWGENVGWISLNCSNDNSCNINNYGVSNDGEGNLSGYGYGTITGWINFNPTYGGVTIDNSGNFLGYAWGENVGWISFNCANSGTCFSSEFKVKTDWRPRSVRPICNNAIDDDNDGLIDYPNDPGCFSPTHDNEHQSNDLMTIVGQNIPKIASSIDSIKVKFIGDKDNNKVQITFSGIENVSQVVISENQDFSGSSWQDYQDSIIFNLSDGEGFKDFYIKFRSPQGSISEVYKQSILISNGDSAEPYCSPNYFLEKGLSREEEIKKVSCEAFLVNNSPLDLRALLNYNDANQNIEEEILGKEKYTNKLISNIEGLSNTNIDAINNFIVYGTLLTRYLGAGERAGVINSYKSAFGKLPDTKEEWSDVIKIAIGRWPTERSNSAESIATENFKKIYLRDPDRSNPNDDAAVTVMAYGLRPHNRNLDSEKSAIKIFKNIFNYNPTSATDWDAVRAIAYSGAIR